MTHPKFEKSFKGIRGYLQKVRIPSRVIFIMMGVLSTIWFLVRVIPKPQRAGYPCMKAAFPFMSAFVVWILTITGSIAALKKAKTNLKARRYVVGASFVLAAIVFASIGFVNYSERAEAAENYVDNSFFPANEPMGEGQGIHPGRVVWVHNPDATIPSSVGKTNHYYLPENNDMTVIQDMFDEAILKLTSETTVSNAWESIFKNFNNKKHGVKRDYQSDETIFIKVNEGTSSWGADGDLYVASWKNPTSESTPWTLLALLNHLIDVAGVPQDNIYVGDPRSHIWQHTYEYVTAVYPNVNLVDKNPEQAAKGRYILTPTEDSVIVYSDKLTVMNDPLKPAGKDKLFREMAEANYLISLGALKAHARAGITLTTKNHFGSHARGDAEHLHPALVAPDNDKPISTGTGYHTVGYNKYRVLVDLMGHEMIGANTLLFFVDGLWGGPEAIEPPMKFTSAPFNNDWSNSIIISQDQVALESVCFDILRYEYNDPTLYQGLKKMYRPHMLGTDDHLHQAADKSNWPDGITYDPENDGSELTSLGVHEHWNQFEKKQYTRNLGIPTGIELVTVPEDIMAESFPFVARQVESAPTIDGDGSDTQWANSPWYPIDQVWINYGEEIPESDFKGEFKVVWSETENALHYLVKIQDDFFADGYEWPDHGYPNFDIVEIFIDEDRSGGNHVFDVGSENAENAFSHHIAANEPADGAVITDFVVADIAGTGWGDRITPNYANHFQNFALKKNGTEYIWEFTMNIYSDEYDDSDPEASRVNLAIGKVMGMSVAYCDNDQDDGSRDNFFGSVWVTQERHNSHWENADDYGKLLLSDPDGLAPTEDPNNPPLIESSVSDYTIQALDTEETVVSDISVLFSDPDDDILSYEVTSSDATVHPFFFGDELRVKADPGFEGTATITLTADDGEDDVSISFDVTYSTVSVENNLLEQSLKCYPNPVTSGVMRIEFSNKETGPVSMKILNINGQLIREFSDFKSWENYETTLDLADLEKGLYLLEIRNNNERAVLRFSK